MTPAEITQTIAKLRRDMPRNELVAALCASCEDLLRNGAKKPEKRSRAEYMREYRRREREILQSVRRQAEAAKK